VSFCSIQDFLIMKTDTKIDDTTDETLGEPYKRNYIVPAVDRAIHILSLLKNERQDMTVAEISEATGWHKSSTYKLLATLDHHGLVARDPLTKRYSLGLALMEYGRAVLNGFDIQHVAGPSLKVLAQYTGESVAVAILRGSKMTLVAVAESVESVRLSLAVGMTTPATATAHGTAVLAYLSEDSLKRIMRIEGIPKSNKGSNTNIQAYMADLEATRKRGYAVDCERFQVGTMGISAPVFAAKGIIGSLLIAMPSFRGTKEKIRLYGKKCAEEAERLSSLLQ
jgi:DNA-binding IclR family transcriptional regulator